MVSQQVEVPNRAGIHARPSALIAQKANEFECDVLIKINNGTVNAKSVIGLLTMAAEYGTKLTIVADGKDEKDALAAILNLFETKFEEE